MKISDLLGEGWESDELSDTQPQPPPVPARTEPVEPRPSGVAPPLESWAPSTAPRDPDVPAEPASARAQLADLAAGLAMPSAPTDDTEAVEPVEAADELAGLDLVVDDLLPDATTRGKGRASSRSGSRRRGR